MLNFFIIFASCLHGLGDDLFILDVQPSVVDGKGGNQVNVSIIKQKFDKAYCKFGDDVHLGTVYSDGKIGCITPELHYNEILLSVSTDGEIWSQPHIIFVNPTPNAANVYTFSLFGALVCGALAMNYFMKQKPLPTSSVVFLPPQTSNIISKPKSSPRHRSSPRK